MQRIVEGDLIIMTELIACINTKQKLRRWHPDVKTWTNKLKAVWFHSCCSYIGLVVSPFLVLLLFVIFVFMQSCK